MILGSSPALKYQAGEVGFYPRGSQGPHKIVGDLSRVTLACELSNFQEFYKVVDVILVV